MERTTMADSRVTQVVNVIEPNLNQLWGSMMQYLSLPDTNVELQYHLVIVDRSPPLTQRFVQLAQQLGLNCAAAEPQTDNPFLNRWLFFDAFPSLVDAPRVHRARRRDRRRAPRHSEPARRRC